MPKTLWSLWANGQVLRRHKEGFPARSQEELSKEKVQVSYCGVCCSHCGMQKRIPIMASELGRFIQAYRYGDWIEHMTQEFKFEIFMKGLSWFANSSCNGCLHGGGMPTCEVRNCCIEKGLKNCYFCGDFLKCEKLDYQKETYEVDKSYSRIKQIGYENWLREQEEKTGADFDNICFLEKKAAR
jgi:hypothetical protein